jgi:hypothetical protein
MDHLAEIPMKGIETIAVNCITGDAKICIPHYRASQITSAVPGIAAHLVTIEVYEDNRNQHVFQTVR